MTRLRCPKCGSTNTDFLGRNLPLNDVICLDCKFEFTDERMRFPSTRSDRERHRNDRKGHEEVKE